MMILEFLNVTLLYLLKMSHMQATDNLIVEFAQNTLDGNKKVI